MHNLVDLNGQPVSKVQVTTQYFDGLGRPDQAVNFQLSSGQHDLVTQITYDALGRPLRTYLPYAGGSDGNYKPNALADQLAAYSNSDRIAKDVAPWAEKVYEQSPLKQLTAQGAPGAAWQPTTGHTQKSTLRTNEANEVRRWVYNYTQHSWAASDYYVVGELQVQETRDEHDVLTLSYTDKEGRVVLKKTQLAATAGSICNVQVEGSNSPLILNAPTGSRLRGIQSAKWGRLAPGSGNNCNDMVFDESASIDVTAAVQNTYNAYASNATSFNVSASNALASYDPAYGYTKWLKVVANCSPLNATDYLSTYYAYDDFGLLRLVIQPEGVKFLDTQGSSVGPYTATDQLVQNYCFTYDYDARHRLIEKTVPGGGRTSMVYDRADRLVGTQDANQESAMRWHITKYDALNRPLLTGICYAGQDRQTLQAVLDDPAQSPTLNEQRIASGVGYTLNLAYPSSSFLVRTITFYDDYNYPLFSNKAFVAENGVTSTSVAVVQGQVTGRAEYILSQVSDPLVTVVFYDEKYRPIQVQADNYGGSTRTTSELGFVHVLSALTTHTDGTTTHTIRNRFAYDAAGRPSRTYQQMEYGLGNTSPEVLVADNEYNEIGQLVDKKLHSTDWSAAGSTAASTFLQSVDYRYNIRGWLININNRNLDNSLSYYNGADPNSDDLNQVDRDLFGMEIMYDKNQNLVDPATSKPLGKSQFNGNISEVMWQTRGKQSLRVLRAYAYNYDNANRLTEAQYRTYQGGAWGLTSSDYTVPKVAYDANGNITRMERKGATNAPGNSAAYGDLDKLTYSYQGNRLVGVDEDNSLTTAATHDFEDNGSTYSANNPEYTYDAAGNLISDKNKGIQYIVYNELNLPQYIYLDNWSSAIEYVYSASGTKLRKITYGSAGTHTTDYRNGFVYQDGALSFGPMPEGRVLYTANPVSGGYNWKYEYHLKDHLGNLRFAFRDQGDNTTQRTASMEPANASQEEHDFHHVADTRQRDPQHARTGEYVARLSAAEGRRLGPSIRWPVQAGDSVSAEVYGRYDHTPATARRLRTGALVVGATLLNAPTAGPEQPTTTTRRRLPYVGLSLAVVPQLFKRHQPELPQAMLRYELFTRDSQLVAVQTRPLVRTTADGWQHLQAGLRADSTGFVRVSVVNESATPAYFDDLVLRPVDPNTYQENHYDPFGLNLAGIESEGDPNSLFQYNGKEKQEDFGLNWTDYGARMYDMQLGRWHSVDPLADMMRRWSTYTAAFDNPIRFLDPDGMAPGDFFDQKGNHLGSDGNKGDGRVYVVTNKKEVSSIEKTDKAGGTTKSSDVSSVVELPSAFVRTRMGKAVDRSNAPNLSVGDTKGGNHEEGGIFGPSGIDGAETVVDAKPGQVGTLADGAKAEINVFDAANPKESVVNDASGSFHVHPRGSKIEGPESAAGPTGAGTTLGPSTTHSWGQPPSDQDFINQALPASNPYHVSGNSYILGAGDKQVHIYNGVKTIATFPLDAFRKIGN